MPNNEGKILLPIISKRYHSHSDGESLIPIPGGTLSNGLTYAPSRVKVHSYFPIEMAFAFTVDKAQGQTMKKVILAISKRKGQKCDVQYDDIYVSFSRTRLGDDIRLLLIGATEDYRKESMLYITTLQPKKHVAAFFQGFNINRENWMQDQWNSENAAWAYGLT